jgi:hypothetical protein
VKIENAIGALNRPWPAIDQCGRTEDMMLVHRAARSEASLAASLVLYLSGANAVV